MEKYKTKAKEYFDKNPLEKEIHITVDGFMFRQEKPAKDHAFNLGEGKGEIASFKSGDFIESEESNTKQNAGNSNKK